MSSVPSMRPDCRNEVFTGEYPVGQWVGELFRHMRRDG